VSIGNEETSARVVFWNGELVPEREARLSIYDSALMFGDMVFEMTRSFNGVQFKLREHLERLYAGIRVLDIAVGMSIEDMEKACLETITANAPAMAEDDEHRLMIDVTRGLLGIYAGAVGVPAGPNVIIADFPLRWTVAGMTRFFDDGVSVIVPSQRTIPARYLDPKVKNRSRIHYLMANQQVARTKGDRNWALLLDDDGFIAEGAGDNFFLVKDGTVFTPEPRNILRGVSRDYVIQLAGELGIECRETNLEVYDAINADEAFVTATPFCVLPVTQVEGRTLGDARMGPITRTLLDAWSERVGVDIRGQIRAWDVARDGAPVSGATPYQYEAR
jgi:branched-chain amino acid aminotransferase